MNVILVSDVRKVVVQGIGNYKPFALAPLLKRIGIATGQTDHRLWNKHVGEKSPQNGQAAITPRFHPFFAYPPARPS